MNPKVFHDSSDAKAADIISTLYSYLEMSRKRVPDIRQLFESYFQASFVTALLNYVCERLKQLGESDDNLDDLKVMFAIMQNPFKKFKNEEQALKYFKNAGTYFSPQEIVIDKKEMFAEYSNEVVTYQFFPMRQILKKFLEIPGVFPSILRHLELLKQGIFVSHFMQATFWKSKEESFVDDELRLPITLYEDEFENNNGMGSHRGEGKTSGIYLSQPALPADMFSKVENIFPLALYKSKDEKKAPMREFFSKSVSELKFLENEGISIETENGPVKVHFVLSAVTGDNLAMHAMFGFAKGFTANYPCLFCKVHSKNLSATFHESDCEMRTTENYFEDYLAHSVSHTGIRELSVFHDLKNVSVFDLLTVDILHDIAEGVWEYDAGLILNQFIVEDKFFTLDELNKRIVDFNYGPDDGRNKPRQITEKQISDKHIKMSASESFGLLKNIGVIIGDKVPEDNEYWQVIILLKEILDIVTAPYFDEEILVHLDSLIESYLISLVDLFPGSLKTKHHQFLHFSRVMRAKGPLKSLSTMRNESRHKDFKSTSKNSVSRVDVCESLAIKAQMRFSHRLRVNGTYKHERYTRGYVITTSLVYELPQIINFRKLISLQDADVVSVLNSIIFKGRTISNNILVVPKKNYYSFFSVHLIFEDENRKLCVVVKDITKYTYYNDHFQAYFVYNNAVALAKVWKTFDVDDLDGVFCSRIVVVGEKEQYIPKRWI